MAGYDPKAKRAHSRTVPDGPAPVDDLLGAPATTPRGPADPTPATTDTAPQLHPTPPAGPAASVATPPPEARPMAPTPAAAAGPDRKVLAALAAAALAALLFWRHRRRGSG